MDLVRAAAGVDGAADVSFVDDVVELAARGAQNLANATLARLASAVRPRFLS